MGRNSVCAWKDEGEPGVGRGEAGVSKPSLAADWGGDVSCVAGVAAFCQQDPSESG